ncbi:MAG: AlbA family DNA-binding domain-containing protein [Candidatus Cyclobacteriaceae bacterium M3_2C_046]
MTIQEIKSVVSEGEHVQLEFKKKVSFPEKIVREIVAFANTQGGTLLIGVDDNGSIDGLKFAEEDQFVLEQAISKYCRPKINYRAEIVKLNKKKSIINYTIYESARKPHFVLENLEMKKGKAYVRVKDKSIQASREIREILRRSRKKKDIKFNFGDKEKLLMEYLDQHDFITVKQFAQVASLNQYQASRTLILLVLANVLKVIPQEKADLYRLSTVNDQKSYNNLRNPN